MLAEQHVQKNKNTDSAIRSDSGSTDINGNWYCQPVQAIRYSNVGSSGSYDRITQMNSDGICASLPNNFAGNLAPFDEEVSVHFRGPLHLKQFAAYAPPESSKQKRRAPGMQGRGHFHRHQHMHNLPIRNVEGHKEKRKMISATIDGENQDWENNWSGSSAGIDPSTVWVTATIDGQIVSWLNNWFGSSSGIPATASSTPPAEPHTNQVTKPTVTILSSTTAPTSTTAPVAQHQPSQDSSSAKPSAGSSGSHSPGVFGRIGYYDSASQTVNNVVFLGNHGGQGSGVFDEHFGASLAYSNCDATGGAASPQILADKVLPSNTEVVMMLDRDCSDGGCGFVRPGTVAHHGFGGADKVFLFEFSMPMADSNGFDADMPAIWLLNAQIPRTLQYGNADCSCWKSGCGELDIAEALESGSMFLKSTIHANRAAGDSDYFPRPNTDTMKLAVVFNAANSTVHLQILPDSTVFPESLTEDEILRMCNATPGKAVSHFAVS
ncbi:PGA52-like protein [Lachnellula hyalina]|uniref:glucan endo-1,3-beta-D-glucosidase n=1 Tax=Lachnellula hyalina TaxID=1316788 RepID=A0A8H8QWD9_9HELO|nr:PGA52-like protein [Lachnellula hyalina]TVY24062.1 PGA52-like protein [Lachnellula hyalina]